MLTVGLVFALFGAIIGSFVGAAVLRIPVGRGIVTGRSSCDSCDTVLGAAELVPVLSFLWQRGRCRYCHARIAIDQPIAEVACAVVGLLAAYAADGIMASMLLALFGWTLVALALLDARHHCLPDRLTLPLLAAGLAGASILPEPNLLDRIAGAIFGYVLLEGLRHLYRHVRHREGLGGGDPKLLAAIGAWLGAEALPWVLLIAGMVGLSMVALQHVRGYPPSRTDRLPLGTLMVIAAIVVLPFVTNGAVISSA